MKRLSTFYRINLLCLLFALSLFGGCISRKDPIAFDKRFEGIKQYREAAEQGDAEAQFQLGREYCWVYYSCEKSNSSAPLDKAEGAMWFRKAAEQGHAEAMQELGRAYQYGYGVPEDKAEAVEWFRKAAEQGCAKAQIDLGVAYEYGRGIAEDKGEAVKWYRKAAEQGDTNAMYLLGSCYFNGEGVPEDKEEAVKWYRQSAEQGDGIGQYELGKCYYNGDGVPQDKAEAVKLFRKSAESWHMARFALIRCYLDGEYIPDVAEREDWLERLHWTAQFEGDDDWSKAIVKQSSELLRKMEEKHSNSFTEAIYRPQSRNL